MESICRAATEAGACAAAFAPTDILPPDEDARYSRWIAAGKHASMDYMERYTDIRSNPSLLLDGARSVLCTAFCYHNSSMPRHPLFADYALGLDYHKVLRKRLKAVAALMESLVPESGTRICVDSAPVRERYWAKKAGIGFDGLNNLLIVPGAGSKVFLAEIFWTAEIASYTAPEDRHCQGCQACLRACPGAALDGKGSIDAARCLSFQTIESRAEHLPAGLSLRNRRIYGCDICQDVCPHNKDADACVLPEFTPSPELMKLNLDDISALDDEEFAALFGRSAVKRLTLPLLRRNAIRAKY